MKYVYRVVGWYILISSSLVVGFHMFNHHGYSRSMHMLFYKLLTLDIFSFAQKIAYTRDNYVMVGVLFLLSLSFVIWAHRKK